MKYIPQRHKNDCGIASFAMFNDLTYEAAAELLFQDDFDESTRGTDTLHLMTGFFLLGKKANLNWATKKGINRVSQIKKTSLVCYKTTLKNIHDEPIYHLMVWHPNLKALFDPSAKGVIFLHSTYVLDENKKRTKAKDYFKQKINKELLYWIDYPS